MSFVFCAVLSLTLPAQEVNFSEHIAPIIYNNCTSCHRSGEIGPMALTNYEEISSWAPMIEYVTGIRYMPPWKPDQEYSQFVGEKGLTAAEIQLIRDWVDTGTPQGDPNLEPSLPDFPEGSQLGTPDLVLTMEEPYFIEGNNEDNYRVFVIPSGLTEDKEIDAIEFRPGNKRALHHALLAYELDGDARAMDEETPDEYGYEAFGGFGVLTDGTFTGYTPGIQTVRYPLHIGKVLPAGADILIQTHYAPLPTDEVDQSSLNIFFKPETEPITRLVQQMPITPFNLDGGFLSFRIQPDEVVQFHATRDIDEDISLLNVYPHCHLLGQDWEIFAISPENDTINIIRIAEWDFNWQGAYTFQQLKRIPAGSVIHCYTTYDNTTQNPLNPNFPPELVTWGEKTTDEMILVGLQYVPYLEGDEELIVGTKETPLVDSPVHKLYPPYPNPAGEEVTIGFHLATAQTVSLQLFDLDGQRIRAIIDQEPYASGRHQFTVTLGNLPVGNYVLQLKGHDLELTQKVMILTK